MKKALLFTIAIISISFTSCKKDWTCTCTDRMDGTVEEWPINGFKRPLATTACKAYETGSTFDCKLK